MATERIRVTVRTADLLKRVRAAKAKAVADHKRALDRYEKTHDEYRRAVVKALTEAATKARAGKLPKTGWKGCLEVPIKASPNEPGRLDTKGFDRDIALLTMSADDTIVITANDHFVRYL